MLRFRILVLLVVVNAVACKATDQSTGSESYATRSSSGSVAFELTPRGVQNGRFVIDLRANTHSGDLSEIDLKRGVVLRAGDKELRPAVASELSGHHAGGSI